MPLPEPEPTEERNEFLQRCMSDETAVADFDDEKQRYAVCIRQWDKNSEQGSMALNDEVSERVSKSLEKKLEDHREEVGSDKRKQTTLRKLKIIYNRGVGAYKTNPSSVRPSVSSPEQWAQARVNSFLYALRNLRYRSGKHDTDLLPDEHPMATKEEKASALRNYPDGEAIPSELPPKYRKSRSEGETKGQACINCEFYVEDFKEGEEKHRFYCSKWEAPVRPQYWCAAWKASEEAGDLDSKPDAATFAETYNDYPQSATNNARKVLRWRDEHGDEVKGMTAVGWTRANQLAKREKISRDTIARMASFKRHQKNAEINPEYKSTPWKDAGYVAWLGWGGTSGVNWAIRKLKQIDKRAASSMEHKFAFGIQGIDESKVDREAGTMMGVSLISVGPALGHGLFVDGKSLETIEDELDDAKLPAYITHRGALFEDRLTREIGMFENFRIEGDRLLGDFQAFDSFREDDSRKYNRLFEMAQKMPERFGLSIVFSATSAWATPEGDVPLGRFPNNDSDRLYDENNPPEDALFEYPSIRVEEVSSADFVDSPAANQRGLFSKIDSNNNIKMTKAELSEKNDELVAEAEALESKLAELEAKLAEGEEKEASIEEVSVENEKLKEENEAMKAELEELKGKLAEHEEEMSKASEAAAASEEEIKAAQGELAVKEARIVELQALIKGSDPIEFAEGSDDYTPSKVNRSKAISDYAKEHGITEFAATLRLGKEKPEIFTL